MNTGRPMEHDLLFDFLRVVEAAAVEAARTMGRGDRKYSDHVAVERMREVMDTIPMDGTIVIGEGERDEAPMLYIGERVGLGAKNGNPTATPKSTSPSTARRHEPVRDRRSQRHRRACRRRTRRAAPRPDIYMDKIVVGPSVRAPWTLTPPSRRISTPSPPGCGGKSKI